MSLVYEFERAQCVHNFDQCKKGHQFLENVYYLDC
jgi:hypothetical protein